MMKTLLLIFGWLLGIFLGAMIGGFIFMLVLGSVFPVFGYWEWVRMAFIATWFIGGGTAINAAKTTKRRSV